MGVDTEGAEWPWDLSWDMRVFSLFRLRAGVGEFDDLDLDVPNVAIYSDFLPTTTYQSSLSRRAAIEGGNLSSWHTRMALWCVVYTT